MKKLLTILTGLSVTITPATQIVSCKIRIDNTYKDASDIKKFWNFKMFSTISVAPKLDPKIEAVEIDTSNFENDLKALISNNFKNQGDVNKILGINPQEDDQKPTRYDEEISFTYYSSASGNERTKIDNLKEYLTSNLKFKTLTTIYFKYEIGKYKLDDSALRLNVTTSPKMREKVFTLIDDQKEEILKISPLYANDLKTRMIFRGVNEVKYDFLKNNSDVIIPFLKGFIKTIESKIKITLLNDLQWVKNQNHHSKDEIPYFWKTITPEIELYKLLVKNETDPNTKELIEFINTVVVNKGLSSDKIGIFLGLKNTKFQLNIV